MKYSKSKNNFLFLLAGTETPSVDWPRVTSRDDLNGNEDVLQQNPVADPNVTVKEQRIPANYLTAINVDGSGAPPATGNTTNKNTLYRDTNTGDFYFIDINGNAVKISAPIDIKGAYNSHTDAGTNGVNIGEVWETTMTNTLGLPIGTLLVRRI